MKFRPLIRKLKQDLLALGRRSLLVLAALVAGAAALYAAFVIALPFVRDHSYFRIRSIRVVSDNRALSPQDLARRAGLFAGTTIWEVDVAAAETALRAPAWVRDAKVTLRFPDQVTLSVLRRTPVAATLTGDGSFLVDADGVVFRDVEIGRYPDLPYLTGWHEADARGESARRLRTSLGLLAAAKRRGYEVSQIDIDENGEYRLFPETPTIGVRLGADPDPEAVIARMQTLLVALADTSDAVSEVDVADSGRAIVKAAKGHLPTLLTAKIGSPVPHELAEAAEGMPDRG